MPTIRKAFRYTVTVTCDRCGEELFDDDGYTDEDCAWIDESLSFDGEHECVDSDDDDDQPFPCVYTDPVRQRVPVQIASCTCAGCRQQFSDVSLAPGHAFLCPICGSFVQRQLTGAIA